MILGTNSSPHLKRDLWFAAGLLLLAAVVLLLMGREAICKCGSIKLWHGQTMSSENSQHIADWYTFSHIIHGFIFYGVIHAFSTWRGATISFGKALMVAIVVEAGWEIFENTDFIINRYREQTIALDYYGDSVLNSVADMVWMAVGFWLASRLNWRLTLVLAVLMELAVGFIIRDNLTLNIVMLLWPIENIKLWQAGAL
jgi:Protein of unknown function (DUF2585)